MTDHLILGGGSAGCVLAARLSEDANRSVVLVEAGTDLRPGTAPADIASGYPGRAFLNPGFIWTGLSALMGGNPEAQVRRVPRRYEQARVLGGGSSINAMAANRGAPTDYDEWAALGAEGWSWASVLPYFRKLEHDFDFAGPYHGEDGPIPIRRQSRGEFSDFVRAVCDTLESKGHISRQDQNGPWENGIFPMAISRDEQGKRTSAATTYLSDAVRARPNLRVITNARVTRLLLEGRQAVGAEIDHRGQIETLRAAEVIVSCGAIHTPALLMRSGLGPAAELSRHGIDVIAALPGVGQNLMEHPSLALSAYLKPHGRLDGNEAHQIQACLRLSSLLESCPAGDLHMAIVAKSAWHAVGKRLGTLLVWVNKAYSRGKVSLRSSDPASEPIVDFRLLSDPRDRQRLVQGIRIAADVLAAAPLRAVAGNAFPAVFSDRVRRVSAPGLFNQLQMATFGRALDMAGGSRDFLIRNVITGGAKLSDLLADEQALDAFLDEAVGGVWHASGTCRMGRATDPMAVTDSEGRVKGVANLRICDASLMPAIPCANTNLPTIMVAERIADMIRGVGLNFNQAADNRRLA